MNNNFNTIDPLQSNLSDLAVIEKVVSEENRLPEDEHEKAAKAFLLSDSIASGIARDFAFVKKIPQYIKEVIENKLWECLYVAKGVVTPYYCHYTKGTDSENFRAFITAKRPNGLETTIDEVDNLLNSDPEVQRQYRTLIYESRQGERTDLIDNKTSGSDCTKLDLSERQQKNIRAANRAAEAIPTIGELLDRGVIAIDLAAKLGRDIKDPDNLTADEREYVETRDLIGLRISQYTHKHPIPEDEYKEPGYSRELNRFVKDLLGIKDRSKQVRMDHPKKAANKLLQFYKGDQLQFLINYLHQGLESYPKELKALPEAKDIEEESPEIGVFETNSDKNYSDRSTLSSITEEFDIRRNDDFTISQIEVSATSASPSTSPLNSNTESSRSVESLIDKLIVEVEQIEEDTNTITIDIDQKELTTEVSPELIPESNSSQEATVLDLPDGDLEKQLTLDQTEALTMNELAKRLRRSPNTVRNVFYNNREQFEKWTQKKDPDNIAWKARKKERSWLFTPTKNSN
ncbi:MAG: hypothetical protein WBA13_06745 [Microcoleaceae cyanobacterium]